MKRPGYRARVVLPFLLMVLFPAEFVCALTLDQRIAAQTEIQKVFWKHRIWPSSNPGPKPAFDKAVPPDQIREQVEDSLRKSAALESLWARPITHDQLDEELKRMARGTRQPDTLAEIFATLRHDPLLLEECLARPALADRLLRSFYEHDAHLHRESRERAEKSLRLAINKKGSLKNASDDYRERTLRLSQASREVPGHLPLKGEILLEPQDWTRSIATVARSLGLSEDPGADSPLRSASLPPRSAATDLSIADLPVGRPGPLAEDTSGFSSTVLLEKTQTSLRIPTVRWPKRSFDEWWRETRPSILVPSKVSMEPLAGLQSRAATVSPIPCTDDSWSFMSAPPPTARSAHLSVWTGTEMLIWGGWTELTNPTDRGGRYTPATDTWIPMSVVFAPEERL